MLAIAILARYVFHLAGAWRRIYDMMPTLWEGKRWSNGKPNPVTLVATVVARKRAVQPLSRFPASSPKITTNPEPIPTRLINTCTKVNVVVSTSVALYLNVFVGVVQAFEKVPALKELAPTQKEPPFLVAQLVVLVIFVALTILATKKFRNEPVKTA